MGGARPATPNLGAATSGVPDRVAALLAPAPARRTLTAAALVAVLVGVSGATVAVGHRADEFFDRAHVRPATTDLRDGHQGRPGH